MSRENCVACSQCKGIDKYYCDNCTAVCCQENMKKHREIFYLNDNFSSNVNKAEKELMEKAKESIDNLKKNYNIYISEYYYYSEDCLNCCEICLIRMKNKYNEMQNLKNSLNSQIEQDKTDFENEKRILSNDLRQKLRDIKNSYDKNKQEIRNTKEKKNNDIVANIISKRQTKKNLEKNKESIKKGNINEIVNDFINRKKQMIEYEYQYKKNLIDKKNQIRTANLEYTEEEKNLENYYLNTINNIKNYSKKIPFFDNWMKVYDLDKYIN